MCIEEKKEIITIKLNKDLKNRITLTAQSNEQNISEYIREVVENDLTNKDICKNQSHLYNLLEIIITNIWNEKVSNINSLLKQIYINQELILHLIKMQDTDAFEEHSQNFYDNFLGDIQLKTL